MHILCVLFLFCVSHLYAGELSKSSYGDLYHMLRYPADPETKIMFEQAKWKLSKNPKDETALCALQLLANDENPYIPALLNLTERAIKQKNLDEAFKLSYKGVQLFDPQSLYTHATLLLNSPHVPLLAQESPDKLEYIARNLLAYASMPIWLSGKKFHFPQARELLHKLDADELYRSNCNMIAHNFYIENALDNSSKEVQEVAKREAYEETDVMLGCYFIKRYLKSHNQSEESMKKGLDLAEHLARAPLFHYNNFKQFGGYSALEQLASDSKHPFHARASYVLGCMDFARLAFDSSIDRAALEKHLIAGAVYEPTAFLMLAAIADHPTMCSKWLDQLSKKLESVEENSFQGVVIAMIRGYHGIIKNTQNKETDVSAGLARLIKHDYFKKVQEELYMHPHLAAELGIKLLQIRDYIVAQPKSKDRADHRKIRDTGITLTTAAARAGDDQAAWALVEQNLNASNQDSQKTKFDESVAQAIIATQSRLENEIPLSVNIHDLQNVLKKLDNAPLSSDSCHALAQWYLSGIPGYVEANESKVVHYLSQAAHGDEVLCKMRKEGNFKDPRGCFEAAKFLHQHDSSQNKSEIPLFFGKSLLMADMQLKKEIIDYCLKYEDLVSQGVAAVESYLVDLQKLLPNLSPEELAYHKSISSRLIKWATGIGISDVPDVDKRNFDAIMYFHNWRMLDKKYPGALSNPEVAPLIKELTEWAAVKGHPPALNGLFSEFLIMEKKSDYVLRAVNFWHSWLQVFEKDQEKAEEVKVAYDKVKELSAYSLETCAEGIVAHADCRVHYQLANIFMGWDSKKATEHIVIGEMCMKNQVAKSPDKSTDIEYVIEETGTLERIQNTADQGQAWAQYSLAGIKLHRLQTSFIANNYLDAQKCFDQIEQIRDLLTKSESYRQQCTDKYVMSQGEIDYAESFIASKIMELKKGADPLLEQRWKKALESAIEKGYVDAYYTWADRAITGSFGRGQPILEKVIDYLCIAIQKGNKEAGYILRYIDQQGFDYLEKCGGSITQSMRKKIIEIMPATGLKISSVPEPEKGTIDYARYLLNRLENLEEARALFQKAADNGDICAYVYLGIMYRDGMGGEQSEQKAEEYFTKCIKESAGKQMSVSLSRALCVAYELVSPRAKKDISIKMDCYRVAVQLLPEKDFDIHFVTAMENIEAIEKEIISSKDAATNNLLYTSGLMNELIQICVSTKSLKPCMRIVKLCCKRCQKLTPSDFAAACGDKNDSTLSLLSVPFAVMLEILNESNLGMKNLQKIFESITAQESQEFINTLQKLVNQGFYVPFEGLLGTFKVGYGLTTSNVSLIQEGMGHWQRAEKNGDERAAYMWALVNLHGDIIGKKVQNVNGKEIKVALFPYAPKHGEAKLKELANKGHASASPLLGQWYLDQKDPHEAMKWYKKTLLDKPVSAIGFLESISREYAKSTEDDRKHISTALTVARASSPQSSSILEARAAFCASYLRLIKKNEQVSDEQALDNIINNSLIFLDMQDQNVRFDAFLKDTQFAKKFASWIEPYEKGKVSATNSFKEKAHLAHALLLFLNHAGKTHDDMLIQKILDECEKVLKINPNSVQGESMKGFMYYFKGLKGGKEYIQKMKLSVMKCCKMLSEQNLKLDSAPILNHLLCLIRLGGALPGSSKNGILNLAISGDQFIVLKNDIEWASKISEKYKPEKKTPSK
ncbi:MAG: hypothetical protein AMXMBFR12_06020 [Candidatus Babeliales bacterium]